MKVHYLIDQFGWNVEKQLTGILRHTPANWQTASSLWVYGHTQWAFDDADLIVNLGCNCQEQLWREVHERKYKGLLLTRHYACYPRNPEFWQRSLTNSHAVLVESQLCYERTKRLGNVYLAPTGVDGEIFKPKVPLRQRPRRALWCAGLINQHPDRAADKGIGTAHEVADILLRYGVELDMLIVDPHGVCKTTAEMVDWYNSGRVYLITSMSEGVPNTGLEAASCGCLVVSTPVGRMVELLDGCDGQLVTLPTPDRIARAVVHACRRAKEREADETVADRIRPFDWAEIVPGWYKLFEELLCSKRNAG